MHRHFEPDRGHWAMAHRRRYGGHGFGRYGRGGGEMGPEDLRAGRMLAQGDLRFIALTLIAEEPRPGYEIIKLVAEKTADWYSPSPGIVYPTLTYLEEAGYVTASSEGTKKRLPFHLTRRSSSRSKASMRLNVGMSVLFVMAVSPQTVVSGKGRHGCCVPRLLRPLRHLREAAVVPESACQVGKIRRRNEPILTDAFANFARSGRGRVVGTQ